MTAGCKFLVPIADLLHAPLADLPTVLGEHPRKVVGQIEIRELALLSDFPNGAYLFFEPATSQLMYVGKSTSRSFVDRIPAHMDPREYAWMNSLPKRIVQRLGLGYPDALALALEFEVLLLGVDVDTDSAHVEAVLRSALQPRLNPTKPKFEGCTTLSDAVRVVAATSG